MWYKWGGRILLWVTVHMHTSSVYSLRDSTNTQSYAEKRRIGESCFSRIQQSLVECVRNLESIHSRGVPTWHLSRVAAEEFTFTSRYWHHRSYNKPIETSVENAKDATRRYPKANRILQAIRLMNAPIGKKDISSPVPQDIRRPPLPRAIVKATTNKALCTYVRGKLKSANDSVFNVLAPIKRRYYTHAWDNRAANYRYACRHPIVKALQHNNVSIFVLKGLARYTAAPVIITVRISREPPFSSSDIPRIVTCTAISRGICTYRAQGEGIIEILRQTPLFRCWSMVKSIAQEVLLERIMGRPHARQGSNSESKGRQN